jgi:L-threonylcarbamoyladenylate synthase
MSSSVILSCQSEGDIEKVCELASDALKVGGIIVYPTESSYAIGCGIDYKDSIEKIYQIKNRPHDLIFPLIAPDIESLNLIVSNINKIERKLMEEFWPGPLTILLAANTIAPLSIKGMNNKIAVRISGNIIAQRLTLIAGLPIIATSANPSGQSPALNILDIKRYFDDDSRRATPNRIDMIINGGQCKGGLPSTIVEVIGEDIRIIREGAISRGEIAVNGFNVM